MQARTDIINELKSAPKGKSVPRPVMPPLHETAFNREQMIKRFTDELAAQTGRVYQASSKEELLQFLMEIILAEQLKRIISYTGGIVSGLDLGRKVFSDRDALREAAFGADAGITYADFAVAETGTVGIIFNENQPRLASIAPPVHVALVPIDRLYPVYENVIEKVFLRNADIPSQFCFITGPSATADIQATPFKGMHGPKKIFVIFLMEEMR